MYCTNCGLKASGTFCAGCGARIAPPGPVPDPPSVADWRNEVRYAVLTQVPEVRERLAAVPACAERIAGEQWLELCDQAFKPLGGISLKTVAAIAAPLYAKMGVRTGKTRTAMLAAPPGKVMVEVLCALARSGLPLERVYQGEAGCVFEAKLPSDLWALEGQVVVTVERAGPGTRVEAATKIPGQLYDWGKSTRCLAKLFADLHAPAA